MAIDCETAKGWITALAVYSGLLTGALIGYLLFLFLRRKVTFENGCRCVVHFGMSCFVFYLEILAKSH